jgi:hypothetical protein
VTLKHMQETSQISNAKKKTMSTKTLWLAVPSGNRKSMANSWSASSVKLKGLGNMVLGLPVAAPNQKMLKLGTNLDR